jgi:hypothetical protein
MQLVDSKSIRAVSDTDLKNTVKYLENELAMRKHDESMRVLGNLKIGNTVTFSVKGEELSGLVLKINRKNLTVLANDKKVYVPPECITKVIKSEPVTVAVSTPPPKHRRNAEDVMLQSLRAMVENAGIHVPKHASINDINKLLANEAA